MVDGKIFIRQHLTACAPSRRLRRDHCLELSLPPLREGWLVQRHPGWKVDVTGLAANTHVTGGGRAHCFLSSAHRAGILLCNPHEFLSFVLCMKWWKWSNLNVECLVWVCACVCGLCSLLFMCVWNLRFFVAQGLPPYLWRDCLAVWSVAPTNGYGWHSHANIVFKR